MSYVRAKAEQAGVDATFGAAPREARLVILLSGLGGWAFIGSRELFTAAVLIVAILATLTVIQRVGSHWVGAADPRSEGIWVAQ